MKECKCMCVCVCVCVCVCICVTTKAQQGKVAQPRRRGCTCLSLALFLFLHSPSLLSPSLSLCRYERLTADAPSAAAVPLHSNALLSTAALFSCGSQPLLCPSPFYLSLSLSSLVSPSPSLFLAVAVATAPASQTLLALFVYLSCPAAVRSRGLLLAERSRSSGPVSCFHLQRLVPLSLAAFAGCPFYTARCPVRVRAGARERGVDGRGRGRACAAAGRPPRARAEAGLAARNRP